MRFNTFKLRETANRIERRWLSLAVMGLLVANVLLAVNVFSTRTVVTLVPPQMNAEAKVAINRANGAYLRAWGVFTADLLGNVQPKRTDFILSVLKPMLTSAMFRPVVNAINAQVEQIKQDRVSVSFTPESVTYDPEKDLVYVTGQSTSAGPGSSPVSKRRTYEFRFTIQDYRPMLSYLSVYDGGIRHQSKENS